MGLALEHRCNSAATSIWLFCLADPIAGMQPGGATLAPFVIKSRTTSRWPLAAARRWAAPLRIYMIQVCSLFDEQSTYLSQTVDSCELEEATSVAVRCVDGSTVPYE